jgi:glucokinase
MVMAAAATTKIRTMRRKSMSPKKVSGEGVGVGVALMVEVPFICLLP